mmetsp:Transcript_19853/g.63187  ORF Transcript_19853/g.63187 Transcript_19853/m.63187 type:complete len:236 (+) Transcript_19853:139-846(+)
MDVHGRVPLQKLHSGLEVPRQQLLPHPDQHGEAHLKQRVDALHGRPVHAPARQQRVPQLHHVRQRKLLREHEGDPPEGVELRLHLERGQVGVQGGVALAEGLAQAGDCGPDPDLAVVQLLAVAVAVLAQDLHEEEERVGLCVDRGVLVGVCSQDIVERREQLVHPLHVLDPRVELGVDQQHARHLLAVFCCRPARLPAAAEEVHVWVRAVHIALNLLQQLAVLEVSVPHAARAQR